MHDASVFISHSVNDAKAALRLKDALLKRNIEAWAFEQDLPFAGRLAGEIKRGIQDCDHLVLLLSDAARDSTWVARELGLALTLRARRGYKHPSILGVHTGVEPASMAFQPRDFDTGAPLGEPIDFSDFRYFKPSRQEGVDLDDLASHLRPRVTLIEETDAEHADLLQETFKCYESLFPDAGERDNPGDIQVWMDEARRAALTGAPWREVFAVLHLAELVVGFAYLSVNIKKHWCFGNYFGVRPGWRQGGRADMLLEHVRDRLTIVDHRLRGIVFEVEPVDLALLESFARAPTAEPPADVLVNLRRVRRVLLYQGSRATALLADPTRAVRYRQPAMSEPLGPDGERELILMVLPTGNTRIADLAPADLAAFLYDDLYTDAYAGAGGVTIPNFAPYLAGLAADLTTELSRGCSFGKLAIPTPVRRLLSDTNRGPLGSAIAL